MYQKIKSFILDTLFPISCINCGYDGLWLCDQCLEKIPILNFQVCPRCERIITATGGICQNCRKHIRQEPFYLDNLVTASKYNEHNISKLVHLFKYNFAQDLAEPLGQILAKGILKSDLPLPDFIIPVPLHPRRLRWRGFNQAELLADYVAQNLTPGLAIPTLKELLIRKKYTSPQMQVKKFAERKTNIQNAFIINSDLAEKIRNKRLLLIDDISTTSATLNECAKVLKANGARKVFAAVIARQEFKNQQNRTLPK